MAGAATLHASCVAVAGRGLLILGPSGSGKSSLALQLMAYGAELVADDRTCLTAEGGGLLAAAPAGVTGMIEARGIGILAAQTLAGVRLSLAVDLEHREEERLPPRRSLRLLGQEVPLVLRADHPAFATGLLQYLKEGRRA